jgi:hypothetical protein
MPFKSAVKQLCGVLRINAWLVRRQRPDLLVLCYHGVIARRRPERWMYETWVDADSFRSQLAG